MTFTEDELKRVILETQQPLVERIDKIARQRTLLLATAALGLIVAAVAVLYGINREAALKNQITINQQVVCAQAKTVSTAYRQRLPEEAKHHYVNRLTAQYEQLLASGTLDCPGLSGFDTFPYLRAQALQEIEDILGRIAPDRLRHQQRGASIGSVGQKGTTAAAVDDLPPPASGGSAGGSGPSGGHGDSTGGSAPPASSPGHHPSGGGTGGTGNDDGDTEGGGAPAPEATTPAPAPSPSPSPTPAATPPAESDPSAHSVLSPVLDGTCGLPAAGLLCTER